MFVSRDRIGDVKLQEWDSNSVLVIYGGKAIGKIVLQGKSEYQPYRTVDPDEHRQSDFWPVSSYKVSLLLAVNTLLRRYHHKHLTPHTSHEDERDPKKLERNRR